MGIEDKAVTELTAYWLQIWSHFTILRNLFRKYEIIFAFLSWPSFKEAQTLEVILWENEARFSWILNHGWWCPGDAKSHNSCSQGIEFFYPKKFRFRHQKASHNSLTEMNSFYRDRIYSNSARYLAAITGVNSILKLRCHWLKSFFIDLVRQTPAASCTSQPCLSNTPAGKHRPLHLMWRCRSSGTKPLE